MADRSPPLGGAVGILPQGLVSKIAWCSYPTVKKEYEDRLGLLVLTEYTTDGHTQREREWLIETERERRHLKEYFAGCRSSEVIKLPPKTAWLSWSKGAGCKRCRHPAITWVIF